MQKRSMVMPQIDLAAFKRKGVPKDPAPTAAATVAVLGALLRFMKDRGLLSKGDLEDVLSEAKEGHSTTDVLRLIDAIGAAVEDDQKSP